MNPKKPPDPDPTDKLFDLTPMFTVSLPHDAEVFTQDPSMESETTTSRKRVADSPPPATAKIPTKISKNVIGRHKYTMRDNPPYIVHVSLKDEQTSGTVLQPIKFGHVDYYPNSGSEQPGCLLQTCSHSRAWEYYAESILNPEGFQGVKCRNDYEFRHAKCDLNDTSVMGYFTPANTTGDYYLSTARDSPYGVGEQGKTFASNGIVRGITNIIKDVILIG